MIDLIKYFYNKRYELMMQSKLEIMKMIKAHTSFIIHGPKGCGKTTYIKSIFAQLKTNYIQINCTFGDKKANFLKIVSHQLSKFIRKDQPQIDPIKQTSNIDTWVAEVRNMVSSPQNKNKNLQKKINHLYFFFDSMEQLRVSESFLTSFYYACINEFKFRFNFIFCGINFHVKSYIGEQPFRSMLTFAFPKNTALYNELIRKTVTNQLQKNVKFQSSKQEEKERTITSITNQIFAAFESLQRNLDKIQVIAKVITAQVITYFEKSPQPITKSTSRMINTLALKDVIHEVIENGPLHDFQITRKIMDELHKDQSIMESYLVYYPDLIMTSIHLADYYPESDDKKRFQDYKVSTGRKKQLTRLDFKTSKHNCQRIIAIAESLESQGKENDKESKLEHHSLDFYSCIEYLQESGKLKVMGKNSIFGGGKIFCRATCQEQARGFMKKNDLQYDQFMT